MRKLLSCLIGAALISSLPAMASAAPRAGDNEVLVSGGVFHQQNTDSGSFNLDGSYGYFLSPGWELGIRQAFSYSFVENARDIWTATTAPFVNYNFRLGETVVPYLGAFIGAAYNDDIFNGLLGPNAGIKLYFLPQTFVNIGYRYEVIFNQLSKIDNGFSHGNHVANIGVGFNWGGSGRP